MATAQTNLTPAADTAPATVRIPAVELSGPQWVARFPTSRDVADCRSPFRESLTSFVAAIEAAGATVLIAATYRPLERAYLMHWSWKIVNAGANPTSIPAMAGVAINGDHGDAAASTTAAQAMVDGYGMQNLTVAPALNSKHIAGLAVDMNIGWSGALSIANAVGTLVAISTTPRSGMNSDLHEVGSSFGVIKYNGGGIDRPHWSDTGN